MIPIRRAFVTSLAATAALAVCIPTAGAGASEFIPLGPCATTAGPDAQGGTAGTQNVVCVGTGDAVSIGPSVGQIATVVGPVFNGPAVSGAVVVSAGNAAVG